MQARYYDPVIGRFYSNDPVDAAAHLGTQNGIHGFNRYAYANNNPYKFIGPDGRQSYDFTGLSMAEYGIKIPNEMKGQEMTKEHVQRAPKAIVDNLGGPEFFKSVVQAG